MENLEKELKILINEELPVESTIEGFTWNVPNDP